MSLLPPVQQTLEAHGGIVEIVQDRISFTVLPQGQTRPYIVWSLVSGVPGINLSDPPDYDDQRIQIDCYSLSQTQCRTLAEIVMLQLETVTHVVFGPWADFEPDTKLFRWSMDAEFWDQRDPA